MGFHMESSWNSMESPWKISNVYFPMDLPYGRTGTADEYNMRKTTVALLTYRLECVTIKLMDSTNARARLTYRIEEGYLYDRAGCKGGRISSVGSSNVSSSGHNCNCCIILTSSTRADWWPRPTKIAAWGNSAPYQSRWVTQDDLVYAAAGVRAKVPLGYG